jgi:hypothetical protein
MKKWRREDIEVILLMRKHGYKFEFISNHFDVSVNAVRKALRRHVPLYMKSLKVFCENNVKYLNKFQCKQKGMKTIMDFVKTNENRKRKLLPIIILRN